MSSSVEVRNLDFSYDKKHPLLRGISLSVDSHSFVSVIGPNGSGKTTLLKILAGILRPERGEVRILGKPLDRHADVSRLLAYVPQTLVLDFEIGVLDFVLLGRNPGGRLLGGPGEEDVEAALKSLDAIRMLDFAKKDLSRLSGGERQKIVIAKALAQDTPFILLDEPTSHLDLRNQLEILDVLERLATRGGKKIVSIMHDVNLAYHYSDHTVALKDGRIFASGPTREVVREETIRECFGVEGRRVEDFFVPRTGLPF